MRAGQGWTHATYPHLTRAWKERVNTNSKNERTCDGRGASIWLDQSSFALFGVYLDIAGFLTEVALRRLHHPQQDAMCFCSLTARLAWPWPATLTHRLPTSSSTLLPTTTSTPHMALLVARTMQHPVSAMAQISVFDVFTAGTVSPSYSGRCSTVALQAAGGRGPGRGQGEVKPAPPRQISKLQSLSARGKAVADQTSSKRQRQCPPRFPHPAVEPASPGFCERVGHGSG